jgi:cell division transport system ATP-binding protein
MIQFTNVKKSYEKGHPVLDGLNLTIKDGEFVFIVGESGAGKTTMMKLLLREEKPDSGKLTVGDVDLTKISNFRVPKYRRKLGVVFQDFRLFPNMTVFENVAFAMRVVGTPSKVINRKVPHVLQIVGLEDKAKRFPRELSGGEQQRVALARALVNNPEIIIADEPTGNIDPQMSRDIMSMLVHVNKLGKTVLVVTHETDLVDYFHQRVVRLKNGKIAEDTCVGGDIS